MSFDSKPIFGVGQVNEYIRYLLEDSPVLDSIYVRGEISNLTSYHTSGHLYFSIKDETDVLRVVMFRSNAQRLGFRPENGMRVLIHGRITVYGPSGQYQLNADSMDPDGAGALAIAYEQLKNKLLTEGLFDDSGKRPIPQYPERIGIITSPTGAAIRDIIHIIKRRCPAVGILLFPTLVQGEGAPRQLVSGIRFFNRYKNVDTIIIGRGGGSIEDLWAFNDEALVRAVAASEIPVISAVGHETDFTLCDFAADKRAPTPSAAAEISIPDTTELKKQLTMLDNAVHDRIRTVLKIKHQDLAAQKEKQILRSPMQFLANRRAELDTLSTRLQLLTQHTVDTSRNTLNQSSARIEHLVFQRMQSAVTDLTSQAAKLQALNPLAVLTRGYAAVFDENGKSVRSVGTIKEDDLLKLRMSDGEVLTKTVTITNNIPEERNINND